MFKASSGLGLESIIFRARACYIKRLELIMFRAIASRKAIRGD